MKPSSILFAEDDDTLAFFVNKQLMDAGYGSIKTVDTGKKAIEAAEEINPDLIILDISLKGGMDGVEVAAKLKKMIDAPIIYITGHTDEDIVKRALETHPLAYLLKPFTQEALLITIEMALYKHELDHKLKASENKLSSILENISTGIISTDANGRINYMNSTAELYTGCHHKRAENAFLSELLHLTDSTEKNCSAQLADLFQSQKIPNFNYSPPILTSTSGEKRIVTLGFTIIQDSEGKLEGYVAVITDITERFENEEKIEMMAAALESQNDAVVITEAVTGPELPKIVYVNEAFTTLTGLSREETIGNSLELLEAFRNNSSVRKRMMECLSENRAFHVELPLPSKENKDTVTQWRVSSVLDKNGNVANLTYSIRDITQLRKLEDNIRQTQKIEAVGQLAAGIAHDFNNLLTVINSYAELLSIKIPEDDPMSKYVKNIRIAGTRGAELVSNLMTFSRRDSSSPHSINLVDVIEELKPLLRRLIKESIDLEINLGKELHPIKADTGKIEQILINLCVNARDAIIDGGRIAISVENAKIVGNEDGEDELHKPGDYVKISVEDNGSGMDAETQKRIFEPFFTTKDVGKGTGLGLSTIYGIMQQLGGFVEVESTVGKGTRFDVLFPAIQAKRDETPKMVELDDKISHGSESILVVEDDKNFIDCISGLLKLHGYEVYTATSGVEATERFEDKASEIKLLISDMVLPKMSGRELASRMLEKNPEMKIIFMTGYDDELDSFYSLPMDAEIFQKPFSLTTILKKVRELLDAPDNS